MNIKLFIVTFLLLNLFIKNSIAQIQHLDATVAGSIQIAEATNIVTRWNDLSGNDNHAISYLGEVIYPANSMSTTGKDGLGFNGGENLFELFSAEESDNILDFNGNANQNTGFAFFLAFKVNEIVADWNDILGNSSAAAQNLHFGLRYKDDGTFQVYLGSANIQAGSLTAGQTVVYAFNYTAQSGKIEFWNSNDGTIRTANVTATDFSNNNPILLGGMRKPTSGRYFDGIVGEVITYNKALSTNELLEICNELNFKWAIADYESEPPTPNPASFAISPQAVGSSLITMTATKGTDLHEPVEYLFTEISGNQGGTSSQWQTNPNYRDGDLEPLTEYTYTITMRDAYGNIGTTSAALSATTPEYTPLGQENELEYGAFYGYQGWHFAPGDGRIESNDWVHWFNNNTPDEDNIHGDMWPDLTEYDPHNLYETDLKYPNGETAKVYSCFDYSTIDLHVKWMRDYGIKGCVVQRFTNSIDKSYKLEQGDKKIRDIMTACEKYGVKFWIMHDAGSGDAEEYERLTNDWKHLVDDLDILQSPAYTFQDGKPVYAMWGMQVSSRNWTAEQVSNLLDFYKDKDSPYLAYVVGGVTPNWFTNENTAWRTVFERLDMLSPWRTIFNNNAAYTESEIERMYNEKAWCDERGIDYNPVISAGASAGNIGISENNPNKKTNGFPRNGGKVLWKQAYEVCKMSTKFMYIAMFDEVDEGTAMYKQVPYTSGLPVNCRQIALSIDGYDLPSDWYLQLGNEIQKMMDGRAPVVEEMPLTPQKINNLVPTPANQSIGIANLPVLSWSGAPGYTYKVYLRKAMPVFSDSYLIASQDETSFTITTPLESNQTYYWRVDIVSGTQIFEGEIWSFTVEDVSNINNCVARKIKVFPVPANDKLLVLGVKGCVAYSIYNMLGTIINIGVLENNQLDIENLNSGIYILKFDGVAPLKFVVK